MIENKPIYRKRIRLVEYDYSKNGVYFITVCINEKRNILWDVNLVGAAFGRPLLSKTGKLVEMEIMKIEHIYDCVKIVNYIVMPNHIHLLIILTSATDINRRPQAAPTISRIINKFKGSITKQLGFPIWQKSYYDHIIRN